MALIKCSPGQKWPGFSFALHLLRVQGFCFAPLQCSKIQAFTTRFVLSIQLYRTCRKTAHRALQRLFLRFAPFNRPQYQTGKSGYNAACATLEHITAPQHLQRIPKYKRHARTLYSSAQPPIIIMYIRAAARPCRGSMPDGAAYRRPRKPGGVSMLFTPGGLQSGTGQRSGRTWSAWHHPPGGAVQLQGRGGAARNHWRLSPHLFSGFRPITNRGQQ